MNVKVKKTRENAKLPTYASAGAAGADLYACTGSSIEIQAGETAKRTLVIFRDCHSKNNILVVANSDREEEKIRLRAMSKGFLVALRKPRELGHRCRPGANHRHWKRCHARSWAARSTWLSPKSWKEVRYEAVKHCGARHRTRRY